MYRISHERHPFAIYKDWGDIFNFDDEVISVSSEVSLSSSPRTSEKAREVHRSESISFATASSCDKLIVPFAATASDASDATTQSDQGISMSPSSDDSDHGSTRASGRHSFLKSLKEDWRRMSSRFSEQSLLSDTEGDEVIVEPKAPPKQLKQQVKKKSARDITTSAYNVSKFTASTTNPNLWDSCPDIRADDLYKSFEDKVLNTNKEHHLRSSMDRRARRANRRVSLTSQAA